MSIYRVTLSPHRHIHVTERPIQTQHTEHAASSDPDPRNDNTVHPRKYFIDRIVDQEEHPTDAYSEYNGTATSLLKTRYSHDEAYQTTSSVDSCAALGITTLVRSILCRRPKGRLNKDSKKKPDVCFSLDRRTSTNVKIVATEHCLSTHHHHRCIFQNCRYFRRKLCNMQRMKSNVSTGS